MKKNKLLFEYAHKNKKITIFFVIITISIAFVAPLKSFIIQWIIDASSKDQALFYLLLGSIITILSFGALYIMILYGGMLFFAICMYIYINPALLLFVALASIVPLIVPRLLDKGLQRVRKNYSNQISKYTLYVTDILKGFEIIHQFNVRDKFTSNHAECADETSAVEREFHKRRNLSITMSSFLSDILFFIILAVGMFLYFDGKITIGYMVAATNLSNYIIAPCKTISQQYASIKSTKNIREKLYDVMNRQEEQEGSDIDEIENIVWNDVGFRYNNSSLELLHNLNMNWKKNDKILLLGKSGSGKTTIIKLFCKYFNNYTGTININSIDLKTISVEALYKQVGIISQSPYLFNDTLKNNICLYEKFSEEEIKNALLKAGIYDYVYSLPQGLDTMILENGKNLSGGQAQRIAIARAVIRNKSILVIDEGTTGLDSDTADSIMNNLFDMPCTVIMATHDIHGKYISRFNKKYKLSDGYIECIQ